jgi:hypothetical protein
VLPAALRRGGDQGGPGDGGEASSDGDAEALVPCSYAVRPWPAADKIRPLTQTQVWVDVFVLKRFESRAAIASFVGTKANGQPQPHPYTARILDAIDAAAQGCPGSTVLTPRACVLAHPRIRAGWRLKAHSFQARRGAFEKFAAKFSLA